MNSNKKKLNDKVKNKIKNEKYISEEAKEVRNFIIILVGIIIVVLIIYGVSNIFIKKDNNLGENEIQAGEIDYDKISVGMILNRSDKEYYVAVYGAKNPQAVLYSTIITNYTLNEESIKVYFCDLDNYLNQKYYVGEEESNSKAESVSEFAFKDLTLLKIKNGKIVKYIEDFDTFKEELSL